jgi:hypothetical protein
MQEELAMKHIRDDLLALGVDVDSDVIERMQNLGLNSSWSTASRAASSLRKRNPHGVPSSVAYQNIQNSKDNVRCEQKESEQEWNSVDSARVHRVLHSLHDQSSTMKRGIRISVLKMVKIFRTQYLRSPGIF